ncbi:hypothetical protein MBLNU13_g00699t1 [Cladosporium sp. NU13]
MAKLRLPEGADDILRRAQQVLLQREGAKLLVYGLQDVVENEDIEGLCHTATEIYANELGEDCEDANFIVPAPQRRRLHGKDVQEVLNMHIASMADLASDGNRKDGNGNGILPFAFVVIESAQWRRHGVTVVLLDSTFDPDDDWNDRPPEGWWWVDECETSVAALGGLCYDVVMEQDDWHNIKECQGRPTVRVGSESYVNTRSRSWSPPNITSEMRTWGFGFSSGFFLLCIARFLTASVNVDVSILTFSSRVFLLDSAGLTTVSLVADIFVLDFFSVIFLLCFAQPPMASLIVDVLGAIVVDELVIVIIRADK